MASSNNRQRHSIRIKGYDYCQPGAYFITICTYHKTSLFGNIINNKVHLSTCGNIASQEMTRLSQRFPNMVIDKSIIMPNHIHTIWEIHSLVNDSSDQSLGFNRNATMEQFSKPISGSIATIVRSYKSAVSFRIHRMRGAPSGPIWQRNYYEHVIRNDAE